ncbi:hypothetical protein BH09BAC2_BH09BAC2_07740 [soil metagenome]
MKKLLLVLVIFSSCSQKNKSNEAAAEIAAADKAMSDRAAKEGFHKTLLEYTDEDVVKPGEGTYPVMGKANLEKLWNGKKDFMNLTWEPFKTEAAASGDLGYTLGNWKLVQPDTILYGNYYTIWKKQANGNWKFVFDGGNNLPGTPKQ